MFMLKDKMVLFLFVGLPLFGIGQSKSAYEAKLKLADAKVEALRESYEDALSLYDKDLSKSDFEKEIISLASKKSDDQFSLAVYHEKLEKDCLFATKEIYPSKKSENYKNAQALKDKLLSVQCQIEKTDRFKYESKYYKSGRKVVTHVFVWGFLTFCICAVANAISCVVGF
jgi:hypothetical protein